MKLRHLVCAALLLFSIAASAQPIYRFSVKVGIDCESVDSLGGVYGAQNETYIEGWEKKASNLLIYKRLCKI